MKTKVKLSIFLFFGLVSLIYVFPFVFVEAAKLESGVTINAPSTTETEKICDDTKDNDNDGKVDAADEECVAKCAQQSVSGFPINYGQLNPDQTSAEQKITIKSENSLPTGVTIMIKGGNWISDATGATISGPEYTHFDLSNGRGYDAMHEHLSSDGARLGWMSSFGSLTFFLQFKPIPNSPSGSFHQEITLDAIC